MLSAGYATVLAATAPATGYTRDEGYYFKAAEQYGAWWDTLFSRRFADAFSDGEIRLRFEYNAEHPALVKLLQGISFRVLHKWLGWTGPAQGFRFTGFAFAALSLFATFLLGRRTVSAPVGLMAAALMATIPRYFYDAHLACFDVPITAMWTLSLWSFWRALDGGRLGSELLAGLLFGLALATKLNALFLPAIFVLLWLHREHTLRALRFVPGPSGGYDLRLPAIPRVLLICAVLGPLVFVAHWPWLWHDTFARIATYVRFHLNHEHYPIRYFGKVYLHPPFPWHFSWMMTVLTVPATILGLGALGLLRAAVGSLRRSSPDLLLAIGALLPIALISIPGTPIFGGVKHWYNAMPALCILAARGLVDAARWLADALPRHRALAAPTLAALAMAPGLLGIVRSHPNGVGYYNELAGGIRGGAEIGMQRSFWGGLNRPLLDQVAQLRPGTRVFFDHTNYDAYRMYVREGTLPGSISFANAPEQGDAATLFEDREGYPPSEEAAFSRIGLRPVDGVYVDEVTFVQLYVRDSARR